MRPAGARIAAAAVFLAASASGASAEEPRCAWVHGRFFAANGAPTFRIWRIATRRILGVVGQGRQAQPDLPAPLRALIGRNAFEVDVYGDYRVCPLGPDRPGRMRFVRVTDVRRLVARPASAGAPD